MFASGESKELAGVGSGNGSLAPLEEVVAGMVARREEERALLLKMAFTASPLCKSWTGSSLF